MHESHHFGHLCGRFSTCICCIRANTHSTNNFGWMFIHACDCLLSCVTLLPLPTVQYHSTPPPYHCHCWEHPWGGSSQVHKAPVVQQEVDSLWFSLYHWHEIPVWYLCSVCRSYVDTADMFESSHLLRIEINKCLKVQQVTMSLLQLTGFIKHYTWHCVYTSFTYNVLCSNLKIKR